MIGYSLVGTNDLDRAGAFYDRIFGVIGAPRALVLPGEMITWGAMWSEPHFGVIRPFDQRPATVGNGTMIALKMDRREFVDRVHSTALAHGGVDAGAPGLRGSNPEGYLARELGLPAAGDVIAALPEGDPSAMSHSLREALAGGVAFHNSDLDREERQAVERGFRQADGGVKVLVATSTVAAGVNSRIRSPSRACCGRR